MTGRFVEAHSIRARDGLTLNVVDFGGEQAPEILFIHGSFGHARVWDPVVEHLEAGNRVLSLDLPGHGESEHAQAESRYAFGELADDVGDVVRTLGLRPVLVGHSLGSVIAMLYASRHARSLSGAVFMDIDPQPPDYQALHLNEVGRGMPREYSDFAGAVARESRLAPLAAPAIHQHLARYAFKETAGVFVQRFDQAFLRSVRSWDCRPDLGNITVPCLVLRGAGSIVMSDEGFSTLVEMLPDGRGQVIPEASHQLHLDRPELVAAAIDAFVAGLTLGR